MSATTFVIQDMVDRVAAGWARQARAHGAEWVVQLPVQWSGRALQWRGDLDALVDRLQSLGHAALAELAGQGSVVLTIQECAAATAGPTPHAGRRLLHFHVQAAGLAGGEPASALYFFEQAFEPGDPAAARPGPSSARALPPAQLLAWPQRILAVDDNLAAMGVLLQLGEAVGLAIQPAHDAWDALRAVTRAHEAGREFDLVVLDARLPPLDAVACARRLREAACSAPFLLMAGPGDEDAVALLAPHRPLGRELGVKAVLRKPLVDGEALLQACLTSPAARRAADFLPSVSAFKPLPAMKIPAAPVALPELPGIDLAIGRASTMNNQALYRRLLIKFREAQRGTPARVAQAWAQGDKALARRLAHDLASVSGTLGAMPLHDAARRLEAICAGEADADGLEAALQHTSALLAGVIDGLQVLGAE